MRLISNSYFNPKIVFWLRPFMKPSILLRISFFMLKYMYLYQGAFDQDKIIKVLKVIKNCVKQYLQS
jgi:hypothetical protein